MTSTLTNTKPKITIASVQDLQKAIEILSRKKKLTPNNLDRLYRFVLNEKGYKVWNDKAFLVRGIATS